jgi:RNA polymerase sigma-70 factor, ECF subfamily
MWREQRREPPALSAAELFATDSSHLNREQAELASAALNRIAPDDRELVELKIFAGLTFREIAEVTSLPQATVATRYRRALEQLRPWLSRQCS